MRGRNGATISHSHKDTTKTSMLLYCLGEESDKVFTSLKPIEKVIVDPSSAINPENVSINHPQLAQPCPWTIKFPTDRPYLRPMHQILIHHIPNSQCNPLWVIQLSYGEFLLAQNSPRYLTPLMLKWYIGDVTVFSPFCKAGREFEGCHCAPHSSSSDQAKDQRPMIT